MSIFQPIMTGIEINNLSYQIGDFSLENLSLNIQKGEYFVLTGRNGSGKSTIFKLIAGLSQPVSGVIKINGIDMTNVPPWKRSIGYLPQDGLLFPNRTVRKNIQFALEVRHVDYDEINSQVDKIAEMLDLSSLLERKPLGLSGGEAQKICIARALVCKPSVLLLDEPVSSVDSKSRDLLCKEIKALQQELKITTLHISHNSLETNIVADRIGTLLNGQLVNGVETSIERKKTKNI